MAEALWRLDMIPAGAADLPEIEAFLQAHITRSMFPMRNLRDYGLDGTEPYAMRYWLRRSGEITDVLGISQSGMVMPQCPTGPWAAVAEILQGCELTGVIGPAEQARPLMAAAGLVDMPTTIDRDEPFMVLDLDDLTVPHGLGQIVSIADVADAPVLGWMEAYQREALQTPEHEVAARAASSLQSYRNRRSHMVLYDGDDALAMTGFNAALPDIVQIGGVYTPPELRGQGHARRALALHLAEARTEGVRRAVLFSASKAAQRAYEAIGFRPDGQWTLCLFESAVRL